jgi:hypothetical protein
MWFTPVRLDVDVVKISHRPDGVLSECSGLQRMRPHAPRVLISMLVGPCTQLIVRHVLSQNTPRLRHVVSCEAAFKGGWC